jgi:hypothetical protein
LLSKIIVIVAKIFPGVRDASFIQDVQRILPGRQRRKFISGIYVGISASLTFEGISTSLTFEGVSTSLTFESISTSLTFEGDA